MPALSWSQLASGSPRSPAPAPRRSWRAWPGGRGPCAGGRGRVPVISFAAVRRGRVDVEERVGDRLAAGEDDEAALAGELRVAERLGQPVLEPDVVLGEGAGDVRGRPGVEGVERLRAVRDGRERHELVALGSRSRPAAPRGRRGRRRRGRARRISCVLTGREAAREQEAAALVPGRPRLEHAGARPRARCACAVSKSAGAEPSPALLRRDEAPQLADALRRSSPTGAAPAPSRRRRPSASATQTPARARSGWLATQCRIPSPVTPSRDRLLARAARRRRPRPRRGSCGSRQALGGEGAEVAGDEPPRDARRGDHPDRREPADDLEAVDVRRPAPTTGSPSGLMARRPDQDATTGTPRGAARRARRARPGGGPSRGPRAPPGASGPATSRSGSGRPAAPPRRSETRPGSSAAPAATSPSVGSATSGPISSCSGQSACSIA